MYKTILATLDGTPTDPATEAVEPIWIIGPFRIAEIGRAASQSVGRHTRPEGIGQGGAEVERVGSNAGNAVWYHIGDRGIARGVLDELGAAPVKQSPSRAAVGRIVCCHAHGGQIVAVTKRLASYVGDTVGNHNANQSDSGERVGFDAVDAGGDRVRPDFAVGKEDERGLALVAQDPAQAAKDGIVRCHAEGGQIVAGSERLISDVGDIFGNRDIGKARATSDRAGSDAGDTVGECDVFQSRAAAERIFRDAGEPPHQRE